MPATRKARASEKRSDPITPSIPKSILPTMTPRMSAAPLASESAFDARPLPYACSVLIIRPDPEVRGIASTCMISTSSLTTMTAGLSENRLTIIPERGSAAAHATKQKMLKQSVISSAVCFHTTLPFGACWCLHLLSARIARVSSEMRLLRVRILTARKGQYCVEHGLMFKDKN